MERVHQIVQYTSLAFLHFPPITLPWPNPFLPFIYSWTRLSLKRPAAKCHALLCTNVIQTSATLGHFTPSSSVWRGVNVHIWTLWVSGSIWATDKPFTRHHLHIWKLKHRHMGVLFHYGTEMSCKTNIDMKNLQTIWRSLVHALRCLSFRVLFSVEKQLSAV